MLSIKQCIGRHMFECQGYHTVELFDMFVPSLNVNKATLRKVRYLSTLQVQMSGQGQPCEQGRVPPLMWLAGWSSQAHRHWQQP